MTLDAGVLAGIPHGFSSRAGLTPGAVLRGAPLVLAKQVHSAEVVAVSAPWPCDPPQADALVTATPGLLVGVVTADCAPVLLADRNAGVVGAAHAGWRGALGGVLAATIAKMETLGARRADIVAAIGPTIAQQSYEVDDAMRDRFPAVAHGFFAASAHAPGRWLFDLPGYVADTLFHAGIATVETLDQDTYAQPGRFYSYRRATHRGEATGGRQISMIGLAR